MSEEKEKVEETFDGAFAEAAGVEVKGKEEVAEVTDTKAEGNPEKVEDKKDVEVKGKEGDVKSESDPKQPKVESKENFEQKYKTLQGMFESEANKRMALEEENKKLKEPKPDVKTEPKPEPLNEDDPELKKYLDDYEVVAKNEAKLRKKELDVIKKEIIESIKTEFGATQEQVQKFLNDKDENEQIEHAASILEAHEDYGVDFDRPEIEAWINTLSGIKHREYKATLTDGNSQEVIDLITAYKEANNIPVKKLEPKPDNTPQKTEEEIKAEEEKQKKLESMEAVNPKKRPVGGGGSKKAEDYDGAFDEANEAYEKSREAAKKK